MQRITPDLERSEILSKALTIIEEQNGIRHGQGSPEPKVQVGTYESDIVDIRTRSDELVRSVLNEQNIKFRMHQAPKNKDVTHFTILPDQAEKLFSYMAQIVDQAASKLRPKQ